MSKPDGEIIANSPIAHDQGAQPCRAVVRGLVLRRRMDRKQPSKETVIE
jgi:hypothetical protein